ncbi:uncharacterized protein [Gossypium hirsutum]|uniref:Uncharacterized protein isoform X1 n=1 Tax=Gossypium hirsutum TaxID=3635 RepID=A0ABM3BRW2_GOSHI|nr:uncharacterized protein LOC121229457 isoform X1 [Gossypium hirsutum]
MLSWSSQLFYILRISHGMAGEYGIYLKCHKPGNLLLCLHELQPNQISNHPYKFHGSLFLVALFGGFISGTYLSRFKTCVLFGSIELLAVEQVEEQVADRRWSKWSEG